MTDHLALLANFFAVFVFLFFALCCVVVAAWEKKVVGRLVLIFYATTLFMCSFAVYKDMPIFQAVKKVEELSHE
jgi:hypothetical protein